MDTISDIISDIMIHIKETLNAEQRTALENEIRKVEGVVSPGFNADKPHLLLITYNTEKSSTAVLLAKTRAAGYTAQLVGM